MVTRLQTIFILLLSAFTLKAQVKLIVSLSDYDNHAISDAVAEYGNKTFISNGTGFFNAGHYKAGARLYIKKTGFVDTVVTLRNITTVNDTFRLALKLRTKIVMLDEVPVYTNGIEEINPRKAGFILDYELVGENTLELLSNNILLLLSNGIEKNSVNTFPKSSALIKDAFGKVNLMTPDLVYKISVLNVPEPSININPDAMETGPFNHAVTYCDAVADCTFYIRRYKDLNQTVAFFASTGRKSKLLMEISDEERKKSVVIHTQETYNSVALLAIKYAHNLAGDMGDIKKPELVERRAAQRMVWSQEMIYAQPSCNVLKLINDSIYIFAHDLDKIFVYTKEGDLARSRDIDYHHLRSWAREIIVNEEKTKAFAKFHTSSNTLIAEVDLASGLLKLPFFSLEANHFYPKKIRVRGNTVYFMTRHRDGVGYTVYSQLMKNQVVEYINPVKYVSPVDSAGLARAADYYTKALKAKEEKKYDQALNYLERSTELNSTFPNAWLQTGIVHAFNGNYRAAIECYNKAIELKENYSTAYYHRGMAKLALKQNENALDDYLKALKYNTEDANIHLSIGNYFMDQKSYDSAAAYYTSASKLRPALWQASYKKGILNFRAGKIREAIEDFNNALLFNQKDKSIFLKRGMAFDELKDHKAAIRDFDKAMALDTLYLDAYIFKGNTLLEMGEYQQALRQFNIVLELDPDNFIAYYNRATCEFVLKNYKEAISDYSSSIKLKPGHKKAFYFRGMAELSLGMKSNACSDFKKAENILDAREKVKSFCN